MVLLQLCLPRAGSSTHPKPPVLVHIPSSFPNICPGAHSHHPSQTSLLMHTPGSFPSTPPGAHSNDVPKIPSWCTSQQPSPTFLLVHIPVSFSNTLLVHIPTSQRPSQRKDATPGAHPQSWDGSKTNAPFEISWQVSSLDLSQPKPSSTETKTHSCSLTLVGSCSNHMTHPQDFFFLLHLHWNF